MSVKEIKIETARCSGRSFVSQESQTWAIRRHGSIMMVNIPITILGKRKKRDKLSGRKRKPRVNKRQAKEIRYCFFRERWFI